MSFREEDRRKNSSTSRGLGLAAAAIGVGVGAALYYIFSKRQEQPDSEGATSDNWTTEEPQTLPSSHAHQPPHSRTKVIPAELMSSPKSEYTTISEHTTTDTSVYNSDSEGSNRKTAIMSCRRNRIRRIVAKSEDSDDDNNCFSCNRNRGCCNNTVESDSDDSDHYCTRNGNCCGNNSVDSEDEDDSDCNGCTRNWLFRRNRCRSSDSFEAMSELTVTDSDSDSSSESEESHSDSEEPSESESNSDDSNFSVTALLRIALNHSNDSNSSDLSETDDLPNLELSDEWDVTTGIEDVPMLQVPSLLNTLFGHMTNILSPKTRKLTHQEEQMRIRSEKAFRERKWSLEECAICFDVMLRDQQLMTLPCTHNFHVACIGPWIQERHNCPVCRKPIEG